MMKKILVGLLAFSSMSVFAGTICPKRVIYNDNGLTNAAGKLTIAYESYKAVLEVGVRNNTQDLDIAAGLIPANANIAKELRSLSQEENLDICLEGVTVEGSGLQMFVTGIKKI